jgi:hypothetical protein
MLLTPISAVVGRLSPRGAGKMGGIRQAAMIHLIEDFNFFVTWKEFFSW